MAGKSELTLEQQLAELQSKLSQQEKQNQELTATLQEKDAALAEKDQALSEKDVIIDEQLQELENAAASKGSALPVVSYEGVQYQVAAHKFQLLDETYTAKDLEKDKNLVAQLVAIKSGVLVPLSK